MNNQKITFNVEIENIDQEIQKAEKLVQLLKAAKSLANDLAAELELKINSKD